MHALLECTQLAHRERALLALCVYAAGKYGELPVDMTLGTPRHGVGYGEYEVPPNGVRVRGRGDVEAVAYIKCHSPQPPLPPGPPPSPRPSFPPAWWLTPAPSAASASRTSILGSEYNGGGDGEGEGGEGRGEGRAERASFLHTLSKSVRLAISSGVGFLIVVG